LVTSELEQRYGRRRRRLTPNQRHAVTVVALLVGTLIAYLVFRNSETAVQSGVDDFQVTSARTVIVTFEVHKPASMAVTCVVRARNAAGAEVGRQTVAIPAGAAVAYKTYTLATTDRAVTGEVEDCAQAPAKT
jgi:hypothetical protein